MRLQYIFHDQNKEPHPFHVKSNWMPPVLQSISLESYLESVKTQLADIRINKPKNNLSRSEMADLTEPRNNSAINLRKADKGTTTIIMNKSNKIQEAEVQLENREHYKPLEAPMVNMTQTNVNQIIDKLHRGKYIDDMTKKWLAQTPSPPRIPVFYTLTKIHKPVPVGRPIISGCDGPTEKNILFCGHIATAYRTKTTILHKAGIQLISSGNQIFAKFLKSFTSTNKQNYVQKTLKVKM